MKTTTRLCALCLFLVMTAAAFAGDAVQVKLKDGSTWRGQVNDAVDVRFMDQRVEVLIQGVISKSTDQFITVKGTISGIPKERAIFRTDIVSVKTSSAAPAGDVTAGTPTNDVAAKGAESTAAAGGDAAAKTAEGKAKGVFVLPLSGTVGEEFRHDELKKLGKHIDANFGDGQIIVLEMDSHGGSEEMEKVHDTIMELKKRHRVVSWIKTAISAAAGSALACDEIYFTTDGTLGAMTGWGAGGVSLQGEKLRAWMEAAARWMEDGGRNKYIAWAMIDEEAMLSYDKDPVTGKVTWYNDMSGKVPLSDAKQNLVFTSSTARDSGFSDGTADTGEDLAKLLNLPEWREVDDYGRKIEAEWHQTIEQAKKEVPILVERYKRGDGLTATEVIGKRIDILKQLLRWWDRCQLVTGNYVPGKDWIEQQIAELQKQMADMKKAQQGR